MKRHTAVFRRACFHEVSLDLPITPQLNQREDKRTARSHDQLLTGAAISKTDPNSWQETPKSSRHTAARPQKRAIDPKRLNTLLALPSLWLTFTMRPREWCRAVVVVWAMPV
jgi:hypothetical protein